MTKQASLVKIRPLGNRVLVQREAAEDVAKGGIILPDTAKKKQETAIVLAVGSGIKDEKGALQPIPLKVGDRVLMDKYAGQEIEVEGNDYVILRFDDIVAVVE